MSEFPISEMKAPLNRLSSADPFGLSGAFLGTTGLDKKFHTPGGRASWAAGLKYAFTSQIVYLLKAPDLILA